MDSKTFFENFEIIANAPGGIACLRELILDLAVKGRLVNQDQGDGSADELIRKIESERQITFIVPNHQSDPLPNGWACVRLGDVCFLEMGQSPDSDSYNQQGDGLPFYQGKTDFGERTPTPRYWCNRPTKRAKPGDVLLSVRAPVGPTNFVTEESCIGRGLAALRPMGGMDTKFLMWWLRAYEKKIALMGTGTTFIAVSKKNLQPFPVFLPPLNEQQRIVDRIEELMALCDELDAAHQKRNSIRTAARKSAIDAISTTTTPEELDVAWKRISTNWMTIADTPESISSLRSLILDLAVHGLLSSPGVGFETVTIGEIFEVAGGLQKTPKRAPVRSHFPYLRVANVQRGRLDLLEVSRFELSEEELERYRLLAGDLLIVEGNGSEKEIGRCALWSGEIDNCVHQNHIIRCRPKLPYVEQYALLFLNSPSGIRLMKSLAVTTSGLFTLSVGKIRAIELQIPPVSEIPHIVSKVDELTTLCDEANNALLKRNLLGESLAKTMRRVVNA